MNMNKALRRAAVATGVLAGVVLGSGTVAGASEPVNQACVGESLSALATTQPFPGAFGDATRFFAQLPGPHGDNIQAFQAGLVPDEVVPNTCND